MVVSIISPSSRMKGNTIASLFLALGIGELNKRVLLATTQANTRAFNDYLSPMPVDYSTTTPSQLVKLLRADGIKARDIPEYCRSLSPNVYIFVNKESAFTDVEMHILMEYLVEVSDFDFILFDVPDMNTELGKYAIENSDLIVFNITQNESAIAEVFEQPKNLVTMCKGKQVVLLVNQFSSSIGKVDKFSEYFGGKDIISSATQTLHYNPMITWACNNHKLDTVFFTEIRSKFWMVSELYSDATKFGSILVRANIARRKKVQSEKKEENLKKQEILMARDNDTNK